MTWQIAVQVTSTSTIKKIKYTLEQFLKERPAPEISLRAKYKRLVVLVLTGKQNSYSQSSVDAVVKGRFQFDVTKDIWDCRNLIRDITALPVEKKDKILHILINGIGSAVALVAVNGLINVPMAVQTAYFTGRRHVIAEIHKFLKDSAENHKVVILAGMGGVGKTQVVLNYISVYQAEYEQVLWLNAESEAALIDSIVSAAHALLPFTRNFGNTSDVLRALSDWMDDESNQNWLLVLDGADFKGPWSQARLRRVVPVVKKSRLIITSQYQDFPAFADSKTIPVDPLSHDESIEFVTRFSGRTNIASDEKQALSLLVQMLGGLPLALEQAGAYIRTQGISIVYYVKALKDSGLDVMPEGFDRATDYVHSIQTVFRVAFGAVEERSPDAAVLLHLLSHLGAGANCLIPISMLFVREKDPFRNRGGNDEMTGALQINNLVRELNRYSLLLADPSQTEVHIHNCVQMAVREMKTAEDRRGALECWAEVIGDFLKGQQDTVNWKYIQNWFIHARSVAEAIIREAMSSEKAATLLTGVSSFLEKHARYEDARYFASKAVNVFRNLISAGGPASASAFSRALIASGAACERCNDVGGAISNMEEAIGLFKNDDPDEYRHLAAALCSLANLRLREGEAGIAEMLFLKLLNAPQLSEQNPNARGGALLGMAEICSRRNDRRKAVDFAFEAVEILEKQAREDAYSLANARNALGVMQAKNECPDEARLNYEKALEIYSEILPKSHPLVANLENNIGYLYFRGGEFEAAFDLISVAVPKLIAGLGADHPSVRQAVRNLEDCMGKLMKKKIVIGSVVIRGEIKRID